MHIKIFHNPLCSKSRQTLGLLMENKINPEVIEYLDSPPSPDELEQLLALLNLAPRQLLRTGEEEYRQLGLDDPTLDSKTIIQAMINHPRLIERPIVVIDNQRAIIGRPPERVLELLA